MEKANIQRTYKDSLFRMIFREKKELLSLYNALNNSDYQDPEELTINTVENVLYMEYLESQYAFAGCILSGRAL